MAWNPPSDTELGPEKPGLSSVFIRMRDMLASAFAADSGAPKLVNAALNGYPWDANSSDVANAGWVLIESWTPTAVNSKDFTWDETAYSAIKVVVHGITPATDAVNLFFRLGYDNGATILSGSGDYRSASSLLTAPTGSSVLTTDAVDASTTEVLIVDNIGTATNEGAGAIIEINHPSPTSCPTTYNVMGSCLDSVADERVKKTWGIMRDGAERANAIDTIQLRLSSGNFETTGTVYVYGLKRA